MRFFRIVVLILAVAFLCADSSPAVGRALEFSISFDKEEYKAKDPIYINFKLENKGKKPVYVNKRFHLNSKDSPEDQREVYLSATSPSGEELPFKEAYGESGFPKTDYFVLLEPGEEVGSERKQAIKHRFDFKEPGVYKIVAVYQNVYGEEIGLDTFRDKIHSRSVEIKIVE